MASSSSNARRTPSPSGGYCYNPRFTPDENAMLKGMVMQLENESNASPPQTQHVQAGKALRALLRLLCQIQQAKGKEGTSHVKERLSGRIKDPHDLTRFRNKINVAIMDARHVGKPYRSANRAISILGTNTVTGLCSYIDGGYFHSRFDNRVNGLLHQLRLKLSPCVQATLDEADLEALLAALLALDESQKGVVPTTIIFGDVTVKACLGQLRAVLADCEALPVGWTCVNTTLGLGGCALIKHTILALDSVSPNTYSRPSEVVLALYKLLLDIPATPVQLGYLVISEPRLRQNALEFTYWTDGQRYDCLNRNVANSSQSQKFIDCWYQAGNHLRTPLLGSAHEPQISCIHDCIANKYRATHQDYDLEARSLADADLCTAYDRMGILGKKKLRCIHLVP